MQSNAPIYFVTLAAPWLHKNIHMKQKLARSTSALTHQSCAQRGSPIPMSANLSAAASRSASLPSALSCRAGQPQPSAAGKVSAQVSEMMACTGCQDPAAEQHAEQVVLLGDLVALK